MARPKSIKKPLLIIAHGLFLCLFVVLLVLVLRKKEPAAPSPSETASEGTAAATQAVHEPLDPKYKAKDPDYGDWNRAVSTARPLRYEKNGDLYTYTTPTEPNTARIMCVGNLMCEPAMSRAAYLNDRFFFETCFANVRKVFDAADFAIANLETCVDPDSPYAIDAHKLSDRYHCNAPVEYLEAVRYSGLDAVVLANNHTCDTGASGLQHTIDNVEDQGLLYTGAFRTAEEKRYLLVDINGIRVAFLSYAEHYNSKLDEKCFTAKGRDVMLNQYSKKKLKNDLKNAKADGAEFTVVYIHFYCKDYPDELQNREIECAREIAEAGADCIIGGHPHLVQQYDEIILDSGKRVPVTYSLGNFITSDSNAVTRTNYIYELFLARDEAGKVYIADEKVIPCKVVESIGKSGYAVYPTPKNWRDGKDSEELTEAEEEIMRKIGGKIGIDTNEPN